MIDLYTEIYVNISHFDQDTEQSNDTYQNAENPQRISELSAALTIVELRWAEMHKITSSHLNTLDGSIWDILQELMYEGWRQPIELNELHELEKK